MDPREKSGSQRNWLENILLKIPGFKGYLEKENRRETDHLLRQYVSQRLMEGKKSLRKATRAMTDAGKVKLLGGVTPVSNLLDQVESKIRYASHGYTGFFDAVKIREAELDQLYAFDQAALQDVEELVAELAKLRGLAKDAAAFQEALDGCRDRLEALDSHWNDRENSIRGLAGE